MKGKIEINKELCKGCGYCIIACPKNLLTFDNNFNTIGVCPAIVKNPYECTGCALCAEICPEIAIEVWKENHISD